MQELISGRTLFIVWREALEAILIVGILYAYLRKENRAGLRPMWFGVLVGVVLSGVLAFTMHSADRLFSGVSEVIFQTAVLALSALFMTQMVFWMSRHGRYLKKDLEHQAREASRQKVGHIGVAGLAALSVAREGAEAVIYVYGLAIEQKISTFSLILSSSLGLFFALVMAWLLAIGLNLLKRQIFFKLTSLVLLFSAAALWASAFGNLVNENLLPGIVEPLWDASRWLHAQTWLISTMKTIVGYNPRPSLVEVAAYAGYWLVVAFFMFANPSGKKDVMT